MSKSKPTDGDERLSRLIEYATIRATCPCCDESAECLEDCTFAIDCPAGYEQMMAARLALHGERPVDTEPET